jgi:uncharacterized SAM-binding protein YcdF (DUF218 family)
VTTITPARSSGTDAPPATPDRARSKRRRRRIPLWLKALIALLAALLLYLSVTFVKVWQVSRQDHARPANAIVVLGAAQYNGRPSPALAARLQHALTLYHAKIAPLVVVTGGRRQGDRFTEATAGYNWLRHRGVPGQAILKEVHGRSTWESLSAVSGFLRPKGMHDVVLVSNPAHGERLEQIASEVGLRAHVSPAAGSASLSSLVRETGAVSVGRLIGYRRLNHFDR